MPSGVTDNYTPEGKEFMRRLKELKGLEVFVGFQRGEKPRMKKGNSEKDEPDNVDIAAANELGTSRGIPERPFIRNAFDENEDAILQTSKAVVRRVQDGMEPKQAANIVGVRMKALIQRKIREGPFAPNAGRTLWYDPKTKKHRRKKSDVPLIDTGQMRQSVNFVVRRKGEGGD